MTIEIPFEIGEEVFFLHHRDNKIHTSTLIGLKVDVQGQAKPKIKYNVIDTLPPPNPNTKENFFVYEVFKTKEELLSSL